MRPHRRQPTRLPVPRILQARTLEWVAISFSSAWKGKVKVKSLSRVQLFTTPWTAAHQAPAWPYLWPKAQGCPGQPGLAWPQPLSAGRGVPPSRGPHTGLSPSVLNPTLSHWGRQQRTGGSKPTPRSFLLSSFTSSLPRSLPRILFPGFFPLFVFKKFLWTQCWLFIWIYYKTESIFVFYLRPPVLIFSQTWRLAFLELLLQMQSRLFPLLLCSPAAWA